MTSSLTLPPSAVTTPPLSRQRTARPWRNPLLKSHSVLPGFNLSLGIAVLYLGLIVLIPLAAVFFSSAQLGWEAFWNIATDAQVVASYKLTFGASFLAALANAATGLLVAWVLVRYEFPGRRLLDAMVDLPFALPTAVAGIALTTLYATNGWIGSLLPFKVSYTPLGVWVALTFIGLPFVVRTLQPVLKESERELEEAAASLGANRLQTFIRIIWPSLVPALLTGFALAFSRAIGEYGSVIFIAGNLPMVSEITPLLIVSKLEQYDYNGAAAVAVLNSTPEPDSDFASGAIWGAIFDASLGPNSEAGKTGRPGLTLASRPGCCGVAPCASHAGRSRGRRYR